MRRLSADDNRGDKVVNHGDETLVELRVIQGTLLRSMSKARLSVHALVL